MIIDVHAHALSERFLHDLQMQPIEGLSTIADGKGGYLIHRRGTPPQSLDPNLHNLERRLDNLKQREVRLQLFGPVPGLLSWQTGAAGVELARALNLQAKVIEVEAGGRMEAMATVALGASSAAALELERAIGEHGFRAVMLPTSAGGMPLDREVFSDLFAFIERRELLVFIHPTSGFPTDRFGINGMNVLLGWPFETTLAITRLIFGGILERYPGLKIVLAHGGGNLMFLRGRLNAAYFATGWEAHPYYREKIARPPTYYLDRLHYDTCVLSSESLDFLLRTAGDDRVLFGSDYPFDVGDAEGNIAMPAIRTYEVRVQSKVLYENALTLLPRRR